jgi:hypothetical protein
MTETVKYLRTLSYHQLRFVVIPRCALYFTLRRSHTSHKRETLYRSPSETRYYTHFGMCDHFWSQNPALADNGLVSLMPWLVCAACPECWLAQFLLATPDKRQVHPVAHILNSKYTAAPGSCIEGGRRRGINREG